MSRSEAPQYPGPTQLVLESAVTAAWKQQWVGEAAGRRSGTFTQPWGPERDLGVKQRPPRKQGQGLEWMNILGTVVSTPQREVVMQWSYLLKNIGIWWCNDRILYYDEEFIWRLPWEYGDIFTTQVDKNPHYSSSSKLSALCSNNGFFLKSTGIAAAKPCSLLICHFWVSSNTICQDLGLKCICSPTFFLY